MDDQISTDIAYLQVSEQIGHSRKFVITAYSSGLRKKLGASTADKPERADADWKAKLGKIPS